MTQPYRQEQIATFGRLHPVSPVLIRLPVCTAAVPRRAEDRKPRSHARSHNRRSGTVEVDSSQWPVTLMLENYRCRTRSPAMGRSAARAGRRSRAHEGGGKIYATGWHQVRAAGGRLCVIRACPFGCRSCPGAQWRGLSRVVLSLCACHRALLVQVPMHSGCRHVASCG